ncbi:FCD domain-containing protein [Streptomyces sp. CA-210063]|uniref:FadR/GntR family transcriptional regulator n=1 Tax=Streptomyces sp. CA-210063 TaxID=2801029 RepID=UPI00214B1A97|nr:FCD domain-containing protein [Streptomyces sp. CA-210063]UUU35812.1 FCD domain-containing protein [Streptomyces sp. CA-210063]
MASQQSQGRRRKPELVAEALLARIREGELPVGRRLPSERDLASEYGVSRNAIREALAVLQLSGHVETRLGDGSYIAQPEGPARDENDAGLVAALNITELLQAREALELASALTAIRRATRSDLLKMDALVAEMEEHLEQDDYESYLRTTMDLHRAVAAASRTPLLVTLVKELTIKHQSHEWLLHTRYTPAIGAYSLDVHRALVRAIRDKDVVAVYEATSRHYHDYPVLQGLGQG